MRRCAADLLRSVARRLSVAKIRLSLGYCGRFGWRSFIGELILGLLQKPARLINSGSVVRVILFEQRLPLDADTVGGLSPSILSRWAMNALRRSTSRLGGSGGLRDSLGRLRDLSFDRTMSSRRFKVALRPRLSAITEHPKMDFADYERRLTSLQGGLQLIQQAYLGTPERAIIVLEGPDTSGKGGIVRRPRLGPRSAQLQGRSGRSRTNMSAPSTTCSGSGGACPSRGRSSFSIDPGMGAFWSNASKVSRRKRKSQVVLEYVAGIIEAAPILAKMVIRRAADSLTLFNRGATIVIAVGPALMSSLYCPIYQ